MALPIISARRLVQSERPSQPTDAAELSAPNESGKKEIIHRYGELPLSFEINGGQTDRQVRFLSRGSGYDLFLTNTGAVLSLRKPQAPPPDQAGALGLAKDVPTASVLRWKIVGANQTPYVHGQDEAQGRVNYLIGDRSEDWHTNIPAFARVRYENVYPGVDLVYYGHQQQLEYDFILAPGVSPHRLRMQFDGAHKIRINGDGDLVLSTAAGEIRQRRPVAYQEVNGTRREVVARYRRDGNKVGFALGAYDTALPVIIDPVLIYSTFLGGGLSELGLGIAVDSQGSAYITGSTVSADFPIANAYQGIKSSVDDAFVVKFNPAGTGLIYSTYFGGNGSDGGNAIAVDGQGSAYIAGLTGSGSFPTTSGALQTSKDGSIDGFLIKLSPSGSSLNYSTFLGGDNNESALGVAVDSAGRAHVVGRTDSTRLFFPLERNGHPLYKSVNAAGSWVPGDAELTPSAVNVITQDPVTPNTIYAGTLLGIFKSTGGGAHWNLTGVGSAGLGPVGTNAIVIDPSNPSIIYAGSNSGVYKSVNGGQTYDQKNNGISTATILALAIDPTTPTTLYAGTQFGMYKSTNGGDSWVSINNGTNSVRINEIVLDPTNPAILYIGTNNRGMLKTTNAGANWTTISSGLPTATSQVTALAIDPLNASTLYAGIFGGTEVVFKTTDGGGTWTASSSGMTVTIGGQTLSPLVNTLAVDPITTTTVYAATNGGGVYKSTNGGANWSQSNAGFPNRNAGTVAVDHTNPAIVYVGANIGNDAFAARLDASGSTLEYLRTFGGDESEEARGVALDAVGNAYVVGVTFSLNFPVVNAFQPGLSASGDTFVSKLNAAGSGFVYSTYLGGNGTDQGRAIAVRAGNAYVAGDTTSSNFPLLNSLKPTLGPFDTDAFVTKLNTSGNGLEFSTYLGGIGTDQAFGIAVDSGGSAFVTGSTRSPDFPTLDAPQANLSTGADAFVTKLSPAGTSISYSTYLGGSDTDQGNGIAVDAAGNAYVVGTTSSSNFPTANPFQSVLRSMDAFVTKIGIEAELSITKRESRDPVMVNNPLTYTLNVTNAGPVTATGIKVTDVLPGSLSFRSATSTQGSCFFASSTVTCDLGNLPPSSIATITIAVIPPTVGTVSNTATVSGNEPDPVTANNSATEITRVSASPSIDGRVKDSAGNGVSGVLMTLSGAESRTVQTDSAGFYQFPDLLAGGNYVVTPSKNGFSFDLQSQTFNALNADQTASFLATACTYEIIPTVQSFPAGGGSGTVHVLSQFGCPWTASSSDSWITITSGASGFGAVNFTVSPTTAARAGHLTVAGKNFAVYQEFNACDAPSFSVATYSAPNSPTIVRVADLNGDGRPDIGVSTNALQGGNLLASVLLNDGTGGFTKTEFATGLGTPQSFVLRDFNSDGKPDIAMTSYNSALVRILFNNGSGGFGQSTVNIPFTTQGQSPLTRGLFAADLNNDGKADLVVHTPGTSGVQILLGNGNGEFTQQAAVTMNAFDVPIAIADVNKDGLEDLILGGGGDIDRPISVRFGNGTGGVGPVILSSGMKSTGQVGVADFNSDGNLDLAASILIPAPASAPTDFTNAVSILLGDGNGHFTIKSSLDTGIGSQPRIAVADFNNDGKPDIAFVNWLKDVNIVTGDGAGGLGPSLPIDTGTSNGGPGNSAVAASDFNGDGKFDIAAADYSRGASVLTNNCLGSTVTRTLTVASSNPNSGIRVNVDPGDNNGMGGGTTEFTRTYNNNTRLILTAPSWIGPSIFQKWQRNSVDWSTSPTITLVMDANYRMTAVFQAAPIPANDNFANAQVISGASGSVAGTNTLSTKEFGEPRHAGNDGASVWYQWQAPSTGTMTITTIGSSFDTLLAVYTGSSVNALTPVVSNDDQPNGGLQSRLTFNPIPGTVYYIAVAGFGGANGNLVLNWSQDPTVQIAEIKSWTVGGRSYVYVKPRFPNSGFQVVDWGQVVRSGNDFTVDATVNQIPGPSVQAEVTTAQIYDLGPLANGTYNFNFKTSGTLAKTLQFTISSTVPPPNPIDNAREFVKQQYRDFLNREADQAGEDFWTDNITKCNDPARRPPNQTVEQCTMRQRETTSGAFFLSPEFQYTGYFVYRMYQGVLGRQPKLSEFTPDALFVGNGIIVNGQLSGAQINQNKAAFAAQFVNCVDATKSRCVEFKAIYDSLSNQAFVDKLFQTTGVNASASDRAALVNGLNANPATETRASVVQKVVDGINVISEGNQQFTTTYGQAFYNAELNRAFVQLEYFGYMRRDPDEAGYAFWLAKLNQFNGDFVAAEMVLAFISSPEYRARFGQP